ncbi:MAG: hypothetical protein V1734_00075 [Nanoarchaeota archaeon]
MKQFNALFGTEYPSWLDASGIELFALNRKGGIDMPLWSAWKPLKVCTEKELAEANQRSLFKEEIVFDAEDVLIANAAICKLHEAGIEFFAWNTGSRGLHISIFFKEMAEFKDEERAKIRKAFAVEYGTDTAKGSAKTLIALENRQHWKGTGNSKTLLTQTPGNSLSNRLPVALLRESAAAQPTKAISAEDDMDLSEAWLKEVWAKNPKVFDAVKVLQGQQQPADRSGKDFLIVMCLVQNGAMKLPIYRLLLSLPHSKAKAEGWHYFNFTYNNVYRRLQ